MFHLKPISKEGVPEALEKAERYRLLNEPRLAESICLDILEIDPDNHHAIVILLLSITDQFGASGARDMNKARQLLSKLNSEYERHYYAGIICERQGKGILDHGRTGSHFTAYEWIHEAMEFYEKAEKLRPSGNDDAILRWNTCVRLITSNHLQPRGEEFVDPSME